jgi:hypothetical protein
MKTCPLCSASQGFRVKFAQGRMTHVCNACEAAVPASSVGAESAAVDDEPLAAPMPRAKAKATTPSGAPAAPINVLKLAKARLKVVERELRVKALLEKERDELRRLILAAKSPGAAIIPRDAKRAAAVRDN